MHFLRAMTLLSLSLALPTFAGCENDPPPKNNDRDCVVGTPAGCELGFVCEEVEGSSPQCLAPVSFKGKVVDALDGSAVADARIVARDANDAAVSPVAITDAMGMYTLNVPSKRDAQGKPLSAKLTLRADAAKYQTFPLAPRVALPIDVNTATGDPPVVQNASTEIALLPIENADGLGTIEGSVAIGAGLDLKAAGALVVAGGSTGVVDFSGSFVVFNVAPGTGVNVRAYAAGLQIEPKSVDVTAGQKTSNVILNVLSAATARVSGNVQIVNGNGFGETSVVLALKETFVADAARGEVPKGLRVGNVTGSYEFVGVPDGDYVVLAAFENDGLVRDPDTSIGGTAILDVTVAGADVVKEGFKVTGALGTISPGKDAIEEVMGTPKLVWEDDSSEDLYELRMFDAFGKNVWENLMVPSPSGAKEVSIDYGGPALTPGMIYQFRATSIKGGVPISQTEDLRGVFVYR